PTTPTYTLSLHDALPIWAVGPAHLELGRDLGHSQYFHGAVLRPIPAAGMNLPERPLARPETEPQLRSHSLLIAHRPFQPHPQSRDRKSTRLNSSHRTISY